MTIPRVACCASLSFLFLTGVFADEGLDDLFEAPNPDVAEAGVEDAASGHADLFAAQRESIRFSGTFYAQGGFGFGWEDFSDFDRGSYDPEWAVGAESKIRLNADAEPDPSLALHGSIVAAIDPKDLATIEWTTVLDESELYFDYVVEDLALARVGKYESVWGAGRIFTPGNLMDGSEKDTTFRLSFPKALSGISGYVLARNSYSSDPEEPEYKRFAYAALADQIFGPVRLTAGMRYRKSGETPEGLRVLTSLRTSIGETELLFDAVYRQNEGDQSWAILTGFYRDWSRMRLYGEYSYDSQTRGGLDHSFALAGIWKKPFKSRFDLNFKFTHTVHDGSGAAIIGASWKPWPLATAAITVPVYYGKDESRYAYEENEDPMNRRIAVMAVLRIASDF